MAMVVACSKFQHDGGLPNLLYVLGISESPMAKATVRAGLVLAGEGQTANPLEFGGDRKTIGKL